MKILHRIILLFATIYFILWIIWWFRIDEVDRLVISNIFNSSWSEQTFGYEYELFIKFFGMSIYIILLPFLPSNTMAAMSESLIYGMYTNIKGDYIYENYMDKLFWDKEFKKRNISTPKIYAYSINGKIIQLHPLPQEKEFIIKPRHGMLGMGVKIVPYKDVISKLSENDNLIVQEKLIDCHGDVRHYRVITRSDGSIFEIFRLTAKTGIASNHGAGASVVKCEYGDCIEDTVERKVLLDMATKLSNMHLEKEYSNSTYTIGWDVIIDCRQLRPIAYCLEGNLNNSSWFWPDYCPDELIQRYKVGFIKHINKRHNDQLSFINHRKITP